MSTDQIGWVLLITALVAYGVRIAARGRQDRRHWGQAAAAVIVLMLIGIVAFVGVSIYSSPAS